MSASDMLAVDLDRDGVHRGAIRVPVSTDRNPFGLIDVPIVSVRNGAGPCAVLIGGCHGDEYEGQVALGRLAQELAPDAIRGQAIILPTANLPAAEAGTRCSPLDGGNLNRAFAPDAPAGPTRAIARAIEHGLLARADVVIDLHSGGTAVEYAPSAMIYACEEAARARRLVGLVEAFALPIAFIVDRADESPASIHAAAERAGAAYLCAELGGGASISPAALAVVEPAIRRVLHHAGVLAAPPREPAGAVTLLRRLPVADTVVAPEPGVFEPRIAPGQVVAAGALAGLLHQQATPWRPPTEIRFARAGTVLCRRIPAAVRRGDGLAKLGVPHGDGTPGAMLR